MRRIALTLAVLITSSASAFALTEADLSQPEKQLLSTLKQDSSPVDVASFLLTRNYVRQAKAALNDSAAALNFHSRPKGFNASYLLAGDEDTINKAVSANIAAMASSLWA
jgi:hypothetical protein